MHNITQRRKEIIEEVLNSRIYTQKKDVREALKDHPLFKDLGRRRFDELIVIDYPEDILEAGHIVTGRSTLKDSKGNTKLEWVKTSVDKDKQLEALKIAVEELAREVPPAVKISSPKLKHNPNLLNQYTITDYHLGMLALECETGESWDIDKAERLLLNWFAHAIETSPKAEECIFAQIGDFLHFDSIEAVTPTSKHILDTCTRFTYLVRVAIRVIEGVILMLLKKYKTVNVILAEGNHDISSSIWLRESFANRFKDNPRVKIDQTGHPYYAFSWGSTLLFFHHAHKKKIKELDKVFVSMYKEDYGKAKNIYAHTGHLHHERIIESNLMILEQHPTLAPGDSHAVRGGYKSKRNSKVITYSKNYGEVDRKTINPDIINDL